MAKISEILEIERNRQEKDLFGVIHLFKDGGFYRAYNWSAWLMLMKGKDSEHKPLNVSRKRLKSGDTDFVFVGFPLKSIDKFVPNAVFSPVSDSQIDLIIDLPEELQGMEYDELSKRLDEWMQSFPISDDKPKKDRNDEVDVIPQGGIMAIMSQVLSYPLESRTPIENMAFISTLKRQLAALL